MEEIDRFVPPHGGEPDPKTGAQRRKREKERCIANVDKLRKELNEHIARHKEVSARLERDCKTWWGSTDRPGAITLFVQHCIYPRCIFSPADAVYCAKFVHMMHAQGTPNFSTLQFVNNVLTTDLRSYIFACTEKQARPSPPPPAILVSPPRCRASAPPRPTRALSSPPGVQPRPFPQRDPRRSAPLEVE